MTFDKHESSIIRELIRNPKISDNQIGKRTGIAVKTVNRKRKKLEERGAINYYCSVEHSNTGVYRASKLVVLKFKNGITRKVLEDAAARNIMGSQKRYIKMSYLGEDNGKVCVILIMEEDEHKSIVERLNHSIIPEMRVNFGEDCIVDVQTLDLTLGTRFHNNYVPFLNMEKGTVKDTWPDEEIFVS